MADLKGKIAVVTGASRGVGRNIAVRLGDLGAAVALVARDEMALEKTRAEMTDRGAHAIVVCADLRSADSIARSKTTIERDLGCPCILINGAGVFGPIDLVRDGDPAAWIETMMVNMIGAYLTCRAFVGGMIDRGWGRIVNVTSAASLHEPGPGNSAYGTSKAALNHFTRHLASEIAGSGVTANVIHPGDLKTDMWADIKSLAQRGDAFAAPYLQWVRWVEETGGDDPAKAADLVAELMSDEAAEVNGQFLWIKEGLQAPIPSWGEAKEQQPWRR